MYGNLLSRIVLLCTILNIGPCYVLLPLTDIPLLLMGLGAIKPDFVAENNKATVQPCSMFSAFVLHFLKSKLVKLVICEIPLCSCVIPLL